MSSCSAESAKRDLPHFPKSCLWQHGKQSWRSPLPPPLSSPGVRPAWFRGWPCQGLSLTEGDHFLPWAHTAMWTLIQKCPGGPAAVRGVWLAPGQGWCYPTHSVPLQRNGPAGLVPSQWKLPRHLLPGSLLRDPWGFRWGLGTQAGVCPCRNSVVVILPQEQPCTRLRAVMLGIPWHPRVLNPTKRMEAMETTNFNSTSDMPYLWASQSGHHRQAGWSSLKRREGKVGRRGTSCNCGRAHSYPTPEGANRHVPQGTARLQRCGFRENNK